MSNVKGAENLPEFIIGDKILIKTLHFNYLFGEIFEIVGIEDSYYVLGGCGRDGFLSFKDQENWRKATELELKRNTKIDA